MEDLEFMQMEIIMELIVDLMLPTQGHFSICNQVDDQYKHSCLIVFMLLMHPFSTVFATKRWKSYLLAKPFMILTSN